MSEVIMFQFICSILLLKGRFESLNKELLSIFDAVEELPSDERVIHSQSRNLCTLTGLTEELPKHAIAVQQLDLDALVSHFSELSFDEFLHKKFEVLRLRGIHNVLCDAVELIPSMYQVPFLMSLIQIFVEIAACLCAILTHVTKLLSCQLNVPSRLNILFMLLAWGTINLLKLIAVTTSCHGATEKANHTVHLVHKFLLLRPLHPELRAELQMFSQQLLHRKLHFSVCGLFPVDFTLLYSMAGAVTTYIIILLQHSGQDIDDFMALCNRTFHTAV
jgi:gustatory receptor